MYDSVCCETLFLDLFTFSALELLRVTVCPDIFQKLLDSDKNPLAASVWGIHGLNIKV